MYGLTPKTQMYSKVTKSYFILAIGNFSFMAYMLPLQTSLKWNLLCLDWKWTWEIHYEVRNGFYTSYSFKIIKNIQNILCDYSLLLNNSKELIIFRKSSNIPHDNTLFAVEFFEKMSLDRWWILCKDNNLYTYFFQYKEKFPYFQRY